MAHIKRIDEMVNESVGRTPVDILAKEMRQSKFPNDYKGDWKSDANGAMEPAGISRKRMMDIASDIFGAIYGNVDGTRWPVCNLFNAGHVKLMADTRIRDGLESSGIIKFVKSYTEDTLLGPQTIYFLTPEGEEVLHNVIFS